MKRIFVIGGGPGGYVCAIKAAQLGAAVHLAEEDRLGGTCLNIGCIPTKALLHAGAFYRQAVHSVPGVKVDGVTLDWPSALERKEAVVAQFTGGVDTLLRYNGVTVHRARAVILDPRHVKVGEETVEVDHIVIATGSVNASLKYPGCDLPGIIDSTGALSMQEVPASIVIVGGGVIGIEFAALYCALGVKVTVLEMMPRILLPVDADVAEYLADAMTGEGVALHTGAALKSVEQCGKALKVHYEKDGKQEAVEAEKVLVAVGRRARNENLGIERLGIKTTKGYIDVKDTFETSVPGIYAIGDCNGQTLLAHAAMAQGVAVAQQIMGEKPHYNKRVVPSCVYSFPEIASCGLTEEQVKASGRGYRAGTFSLSGNGKALINDAGGGMIKIIADEEVGEVLGVHMIGSNVTEIISEAAICMNMEGTVEDMVQTIHAHPSVSEAVNEAAWSVFGKAIHGV